MELGILEVLRIILGLLLIFFLPGYLLVKALFPGKNELDKEYNLIYEIGLGMGLSIVVAILDGFLLGSLHQLVGFRMVDGTEKGYFDTPYIVTSLLVICLLLFVAAWYRGAFPWMGRLHPSLTRVPASENPRALKERMDNLIKELWDLSRERERLRREVRDFERKARAHGSSMKLHYRKRLEQSRRELEEVDKRMKELEDRRSEELAGVEEERARRREEKEKRRKARGWFGRSEEDSPAEDRGPAEETDGEKLAKQEPSGTAPGKEAGPPAPPPDPAGPPAPMAPPPDSPGAPTEERPPADAGRPLPDERPPAEAGGLHPRQIAEQFGESSTEGRTEIGGASLPPQTGEARRGEEDRRSFGPPKGGGLLSDEAPGPGTGGQGK